MSNRRTVTPDRIAVATEVLPTTIDTRPSRDRAVRVTSTLSATYGLDFARSPRHALCVGIDDRGAAACVHDPVEAS